MTVKANTRSPQNAPGNSGLGTDGGGSALIKRPGFSLFTQLSIILIVISLATYSNTLMNGYAFDDAVMIEKNTIVSKGFAGIPELLVTPHMRGFLVIPNDVYRPLSLVMFAAEYQFFGANPFVGHLMNIVVFALCVFLLFLFLDKLFGGAKTIVAFFAALIFAVHPIHTEVVANIKSRDELLSYCFAFLSLILFMKYMDKGRVGDLIFGGVILYMSYLSKESSIAFFGLIPFIFFFYYYTDRKRASAITATTVLVSSVFLIVRIIILNKYHANIPTPVEFIDNPLSAAPGPVSRFATIVVMLGMYIKLLFVPYPLLCNYSFNSIPFSNLASLNFWISFTAYVLLGYVAISRWLKCKSDPWAFAIVFFMATIFLFSNIPLLIAGAFAERFVFFASTAYCIAVALAVDKWLLRPTVPSIRALTDPKVIVVGLPLVLLFGGVTMARNADWKNSSVLFKRDVVNSPNDSRLHHHLALALDFDANSENDSLQRRRMEYESIEHLKRSLEIYPGYIAAMADVANVYSKLHQNDSAETYFLKTLSARPTDVVALNNLASLYYNAEKYQLAVDYFSRALILSPEKKFSLLNLARAFTKLKEYDSVIKYARQTVAMDQGFTEGEREMAEAFNHQSNVDSAEFHYRKIAAILPDNANAANDFGIFYFTLKKYDSAIVHFKRTVTLDANYTNAWANLGVSLYMIGRYQESITAFNKEFELDPHNGQDLPYIAIAYQKMGNLEMAKKYEAIIKQIDPKYKLP